MGEVCLDARLDLWLGLMSSQNLANGSQAADSQCFVGFKMSSGELHIHPLGWDCLSMQAS